MVRKRAKRERKSKWTRRTTKQERKPHVQKTTRRIARSSFVQKELFEKHAVEEMAKTSQKTKPWIYILVIMIIIILVLLLIKLINSPRTANKDTKSSSVLSATAVVTQQVIQEQAVIEKSEIPIANQERITTIYFASNKWEVTDLSAKEKSKVDTLVSKLSGNKTIKKLFVYGFADRAGLRSYNMVVSEKRAGNIAAFLSEKTGIELNKILIQGKGEVLEGTDGVSNPLFRKVEIIRK